MAGYASLADLLADLHSVQEGDVYRVELRGLHPDPRVALRASIPDAEDREKIARKLQDLDSRSPDGVWTQRILDIIAQNPAIRAGTICKLAGMEKQDFKLRVRKLKALGLTESLEVGYRLSPRGEVLRMPPSTD